MQIADRMAERLPDFYLAREKNSSLYHLLSGFAKIISEQEKYLLHVKGSHWVDTAQETDLDRLAAIVGIPRKRNEGDKEYRERIKLTTMALQKVGTIETIRRHLAAYLAASKEDVILVENPHVELNLEEEVISGDTWAMTSYSIFDEPVKITLSLQEGEAINPTLIDTASNVALRYRGTLKKGETLTIANGKALLNGVTDVTSKLTIEPYSGTASVPPPSASELREFFHDLRVGSSTAFTPPTAEERASVPLFSEPFSTSTSKAALDASTLKVLRRPSKWLYKEKLSDSIARFDGSRFDDGVFFKPIPPTLVSFIWNAWLLAAFEVNVTQSLLDKNKMTKQALEDTVNSIKAVGVRALITTKPEEPEIVKAEQKVRR